MINKLRLENFRGVKEGEIKLSPLTILVGANNSGKTTILEALFLLPNPLRDVPYENWSAVRTVHYLHETLDCEGYAFLLYKYIADKAVIEWNDEYYLKLIKRGDIIYLSTNVKSVESIKIIDENIECFGGFGVYSSKELFIKWEYPEVKTHRKFYYSSRDEIKKLIATPVLAEQNEGKGKPEVKSKLLAPESLLISPELIKPAQIYLKNNWAYIMNLGITKKVAEEVSELTNEKFRDITIEPWLGGKLAIYGFREDGARIRLEDLGAGSQIYIVARMLYEIKKPQILLWDDVEAHMNPRMLIRVAELFADLIDEGKQVVVATHSLEAVKTIASLNEEVARIYLTSVEEGILRTRSLTLEEVEELLKAGIDIRLAESVIL
jgi:energy-coupling factor transporter ATP-binding protein EcfA2